MYHCDAGGWEGETPAQHQEPIFTQDTTRLWTLRVCPACCEEVYQITIVREPPEAVPCPACGAPRQGYRLRETGAWVWLVCGCQDRDIDQLDADGPITRIDNGLQDALGEQDYRD